LIIYYYFFINYNVESGWGLRSGKSNWLRVIWKGLESLP